MNHKGISWLEHRFNVKIDNDLIAEVYEFLINLEKVHGNDLSKKNQQQEFLEIYIEQNNLYFDKLPFSKYLDEGAEQKVFFLPEENIVVKLNDAIFYANWSQYFESLMMHNILFRSTRYVLKGFIKLNKILYSVVQQEYIRTIEKTSIERVRDFMIERGFTLKRRNDYLHPALGIIVEDLHEENVLTKSGTFFFIDTVIYII